MFSRADVHHSDFFKQYRLYLLLRAARFGLILQKTATISFRTIDQSLHVVKRVVWAVNGTHVILKDYPRLPLQAIVGVELDERSADPDRPDHTRTSETVLA
ncbi:MAG: hypothetical protein WBA12_05635 [Catalinimonas sp.]